jgi:hypothetical protein
MLLLFYLLNHLDSKPRTTIDLFTYLLSLWFQLFYNIIYVDLCRLYRLSSFTKQYAFKIYSCFGLTVHLLFFWLNNILFYGCTIVYMLTYWKIPCLLPLHGNYKEDYCDHLCVGVFIDISFQVNRVLARTVIAGLHGKSMYTFVRNCLFKWVHHFAAVVTMNESPYCCPSSLAIGMPLFWILAILVDVQWYLIVLICNYLMISNHKHLFIFFAINLSSSMRCLGVSLVHFLNWAVCFLCIECLEILYIF